MNTLNKRYGFWTTVAMVVGIVIGSGVFFKSDDVLLATNGNMGLALLAWLIGGSIMIVTAYIFSQMATRIQKVNGLVDYFEAAYGSRAGYLVSWFMSTIYFPGLAAILAWVSANYTLVLFGLDSGVWALAFIYLTLITILNITAPIIAGRVQVSTTIIKLIPLALVAIAGTISGLFSGQLFDNFTHVAKSVSSQSGGGLAVATVATAFAYEGWIIATSINSELKNGKKDLPRALMVGTATIVVVYVLFYIGISGVLTNDQLILAGDNAPVEVLSKIFKTFGGTLLSVFVVVSCIGTLNGLVMANSRGIYSGAVRDMGPAPKLFSKVSKKTNTPLPSAILGYFFALCWLTVWYGNFAGWFNGFLDFSELPITFLYVIYIAIYIWYMKTFTHLGFVSRYVMPILASMGSLYMIWGASKKEMFFTFLIIFLCIMGLGALLSRKSK